MKHQIVLILDFGSQYTQLIARRVRELGVYSEIRPFSLTADQVREIDPVAVVLSGGPASVYEAGAPHVERGVLELGVPVLGICYGMQLMAHLMGGRVEAAGRREFGPAEVELVADGFLGSRGERHRVWASHGDRIEEMPEGFRPVARSENAPLAAAWDERRRMAGIQFHPEVVHTEHGMEYLRRFLFGVAGARGDWGASAFAEEAIASVRAQVGEGDVVMAVSGGVDSSVTAALLQRALGARARGYFVDNGLLRKGESEWVMSELGRIGFSVERVDAASLFLERLRGVVDPEAKRKAIGAAFIDVFQDVAKRAGGARFLAQGTIYPDVIESGGTGVGPSHVIKSHHNVGGLPERMGLALVEPLRMLFKDEVRRLGELLGLSHEFVQRQPFPGPGLGVRVLGEVTEARLRVLREADALFTRAIEESGLHLPGAGAARVGQYFAVLLPVRSVGVMGDYRTYEDVVALRAVATADFMTADWARLPHELLATVSSRIVNEVRGVNRVVYDVSSKPPATIEWE